ncbi:class I SAM-dependent methyltransferase [Streptomyces profundus]|uniref:class I SAM-dependent methyltransferase n=1 Tax=Streptomyces profundus TaxID=2867410 RepID=UPI001D16052F|nr:class I SAM-dependent methyltransferase [Streptomyces sp. MA3_2.13]UED84589.1 class I SAM-dependent methyltransferase [Streptomyces sp. MA3_2.13]
MTRVAPPPPAPADPPHATETFGALLTEPGQRLLDELRSITPAEELSAATRLRREHPPELVAAALGQARLRQRAAAKFGADAALMYFTPDGVEQATRSEVAAWRAARLAGAGGARVADLCCGVGGDAIALARAGARVLAVDRSPLTCAVARANAAALGLADRIEVREAAVEAAVEDLEVGGFDAAFVDPARRGGRGRVFDPEGYSPPLSWATALAARLPRAALKIAPGVPHEAIPAAAEAEWVSHRGEVKEAVLWFGAGAAPGTRRATVLPGGHSLTGAPEPAPAGEPGRYLYEPDGAVIRAGLVGAVAETLDARLLDPSIAYLTCDRPAATRYATGYEITDVLPFHLKRLRALVRERDIGTLTVKKRGSPLTPEELLRRVKPRGRGTATVFLTRVAGAPSMLIGHPL